MDQDTKGIIPKNNEEAIQNGAKELNTIFENVLPWTLETESSEMLLKAHTLQDSEKIVAFLNSFYLFKVTEISVSESVDDIPELIYKRQQALITAA
ncbi:MAG: hypothetical protein PHR06_00750, partial [Candidatus Cloacimonetes bacterium]|nr:hypothetical protein [Candidatus Cloacimonadota bacterium]